MRTIQVLNVRWFNATAWYGLFLARLLNEAGHPTLVLTQPGAPACQRAREWGLEAVEVDLNSANPLKQPFLLRRLGGLIRSFKPDIVNCHRGEGFALFGLLRALGFASPFALVRTRGDQRLPRANRANRLLYGRVADGVIATNSRMAAHLEKKMGIDPARLHTILGGVDGGEFRFDPEGRRRVREEFNFSEGTFVFGLLGRLDPVKGHHDFLRAAGALARAGYPVGALVLGFDSNLTTREAEEWIRQEGLEGRAFVTGRRPDVAACLSALDAGVVASTGSEAIARAAFELLACERPIVSTNVGVMPDIVAQEGLCSPHDSAALAERMGRLMRDEDYLHRLAAQQAERLSAVRSEEFLRRTLAAYAAAVARRGHKKGASNG